MLIQIYLRNKYLLLFFRNFKIKLYNFYYKCYYIWYSF